jgi:hypothetical protein
MYLMYAEIGCGGMLVFVGDPKSSQMSERTMSENKWLWQSNIVLS